MPEDWHLPGKITALPPRMLKVRASPLNEKIPVSFKIEVDYNLSVLKVTINNHENLECFSKSFPPEQINDDLLDALISYLMRRDNRLIRLDISEADKALIQNNLASYQQEQADLLAKIRYEEDKAPLNKEPFKIANPVKAIFFQIRSKKLTPHKRAAGAARHFPKEDKQP